jgi:predicted metalloprotease with PDZ domain
MDDRFWRYNIFKYAHWVGIWIIFLAFSAAAAPPRQVSYLLEPVHTENGARMRIELRFTGHESGRTELVLPSRTAGQSQLYDAIQKLEILTPKLHLANTSEPWVKVITHPPEQEIRLRYELVQDRADALRALRGAGFRPIIQPTYFHWLGSAWVRPGLDEADAISFSLTWKNLPPEWVISNTFGSNTFGVNQREQTFTSTLRSFSSAVFVGGDFRLRSVKVRDHMVQIALRGAWQFTDEEFATLVGKIFALERGFWDDYNYPNYLITLLPLEAPANGAANSGTGLSDSFATFATPNSTLHDLKYLLAHELFHNWNPRRLGRIPNPPEVLYWFTEGVTDYYALRLLWRGGLITWEEYLARYNDVLRNYYTSPMRNETNERLARDFFNHSELSRLAYWRGQLLAGNWDVMIRNVSGSKHSLDDVMRDLFQKANRAELNLATISAAVQRYANEDVLPELQRVMDGGELIVPHPNLFGVCAERTMIEVGEYELGFDLEALQTDMMIQRVVPNSAAYRAGLRDGQRVIKRPAFQSGDASQEIMLTVKEGTKEKTIRFFPSRSEKISVPQFKLQVPRNATQKRNCERAF